MRILCDFVCCLFVFRFLSPESTLCIWYCNDFYKANNSLKRIDNIIKEMKNFVNLGLNDSNNNNINNQAPESNSSTPEPAEAGTKISNKVVVNTNQEYSILCV